MTTEYTLRDFTPNDAESITENANNPRVAKFLSDRFPYPYTLKDAREFIDVFIPSSPGKVFAVDIGGEAVGAIGVHLQREEHRMNGELGYWLGEKYWNKGIISSAIPVIVEYSFKTFNIHKIYARIFADNRASGAVLEKNGFKLEARLIEHVIKNGKYMDELIYAVFNK